MTSVGAPEPPYFSATLPDAVVMLPERRGPVHETNERTTMALPNRPPMSERSHPRGHAGYQNGQTGRQAGTSRSIDPATAA